MKHLQRISASSTLYSVGKQRCLIDEFFEGEILFLREELVRKELTIDKLLSILSTSDDIIERDKQKVSHKSCQIGQSDKTKETSTQADKI